MNGKRKRKVVGVDGQVVYETLGDEVVERKKKKKKVIGRDGKVEYLTDEGEEEEERLRVGGRPKAVRKVVGKDG